MIAKIANYGKKMMLGAAVCAMMTGSALALDGTVFFEQLKAGFKKNQISLKHGNINVDGANIVVEGIEFSLLENTNEDSDTSFPVGTVTFNGVEENSDGSFIIDEVVVNDIDHQVSDMSLAISGITATKMYVPAEGKIVSITEQLPYERIAIRQFSLGEQGATIFNLRDAEVRYQRRNFVESDFSIQNFTLNLNAISGMGDNELALLSELGYNGSFEGSVESSVVWDAEGGEISFDISSIDLKDVGKISLAINLGGVTEAWAQAVTKLFEQMQANPQAEQTASLAMLGLMQQLSVKTIAVRFDDDSVTNRVLDTLAKKEETSKEKIIEMAAQSVQSVAGMMLGKSDLTEILPREIEAFLKNPQAFHVTSWPSEPVSFAIISATAMTDPRDLIGVLNVEVKAKEQKGTL